MIGSVLNWQQNLLKLLGSEPSFSQAYREEDEGIKAGNRKQETVSD